MLTCAFPRHHKPLDERDGGKQENSKRTQPDETCPRQRPVELRIGRQNEIAEPGNRTDKFTDNCADYRKRYGHF